MTFSPGTILPFPLSESRDVPIWPLSRTADEYAASPIDLIRSFLREQDLVYSNRSQWNNLFAVAAHVAFLQRRFSHESVTSFAYLTVTAPTALPRWKGPHLLNWHSPAQFDWDLPALYELGPLYLEPSTYSLVSTGDVGPDDQLTFPLRGDFSPSKELIELWVTSVKSYASESQLTKFNFALAPSDLELKQEFTRTLQSTLGIIAQQLRYERSEDVHITRGGRFTPKFQLELGEQYLIGGYELTTFLTLLGNELSQAVASGAEIKGGWGHLSQDQHGDLVYVLQLPNVITDQSFVRATRVE